MTSRRSKMSYSNLLVKPLILFLSAISIAFLMSSILYISIGLEFNIKSTVSGQLLSTHTTIISLVIVAYTFALGLIPSKEKELLYDVAVNLLSVRYIFVLIFNNLYILLFYLFVSETISIPQEVILSQPIPSIFGFLSILLYLYSLYIVTRILIKIINTNLYKDDFEIIQALIDESDKVTDKNKNMFESYYKYLFAEIQKDNLDSDLEEIKEISRMIKEKNGDKEEIWSVVSDEHHELFKEIDDENQMDYYRNHIKDMIDISIESDNKCKKDFIDSYNNYEKDEEFYMVNDERTNKMFERTVDTVLENAHTYFKERDKNDMNMISILLDSYKKMNKNNVRYVIETCGEIQNIHINNSNYEIFEKNLDKLEEVTRIPEVNKEDINDMDNENKEELLEKQRKLEYYMFSVYLVSLCKYWFKTNDNRKFKSFCKLMNRDIGRGNWEMTYIHIWNEMGSDESARIEDPASDRSWKDSTNKNKLNRKTSSKILQMFDLKFGDLRNFYARYLAICVGESITSTQNSLVKRADYFNEDHKFPFYHDFCEYDEIEDNKIDRISDISRQNKNELDRLLDEIILVKLIEQDKLSKGDIIILSEEKLRDRKQKERIHKSEDYFKAEVTDKKDISSIEWCHNSKEYSFIGLVGKILDEIKYNSPYFILAHKYFTTEDEDIEELSDLLEEKNI